MLDIVVKKYNNIKHSATKYKPNEIFFSHSEKFFEKVLGNIKGSFTQIGKEFKNFNENDKCLLKAKFKIKRKFQNNKEGILVYNRIRYKKNFKKINVTIIKKIGDNYKIKIAKDYSLYNIFKDDEYIVSFKLLKKCTEEAWNKILKEKNPKIDYENLCENNDYYSEDEEEFVNKYKIEIKK